MSISYEIFPDVAPGRSGVAPTGSTGRRLSAQGWNVIETAEFNNDRQLAVNGRLSVTKYWPNPKWTWEFVYGIDSGLLNDNPSRVIQLNAPFTDKDILAGFYTGMQGVNRFAYRPPDSIYTDQRLLTPDANKYSELLHQIGAYPSSGTTTKVAYRVLSVTILNGVATVTLNSQPSSGLVGDAIAWSGLGNATFLNSTSPTITAVSVTANTVSFASGHANYGPTAETQGMGAVTVNMQLVNESVQLIDTTTLHVYVNGISSSDFTLQQPQTIDGYPGYALLWGTAPGPTDIITADFTYYYLSRFFEDTQQYENFDAMLWGCSSVKITQDTL